MKKKLTFLTTVLLLAVGWSTSASAQELDKNGGTRYGLNPVGAPLKPLYGPTKGFMHSSMPNSGASITAAPQNAPQLRQAQMKTLTKAEAEALTYNWENPTTHESGTNVPATQVAKDPYQIYELLKFVYTEPAFPGPYTNAYTSGGQTEDPVYYGGIAGGWDIAFETQSLTPTTLSIGSITIHASSYGVFFKSIMVYDANTGATLTSWTANDSYTSFTQDGYTYEYYNMPNGWTVDDYRYLFRADIGTYNSNYFGFISSGDEPGSITISGNALGNATNVRVVIRALQYETGQYITIGNESKSLTNSETSYTWYVNGPTAIDKETTPTDVLITLENSDCYVNTILARDARTKQTIAEWVASTTSLPAGWYASNTLSRSYFDQYPYCNMADGGTIRISGNVFAGSDSIDVLIYARATDDNNTGGLFICDYRTYWELEGDTYVYGRTIRFPETIPSETYKPTDEGYTALIVAVKNQGQIFDWDDTFEDGFGFTTKQEVIDYIANNVDSVKLLTDGMRIGTGEDIGTVFNCDGTYNKFFFLGKGRARKKASAVLTAIGLSSQAWPSYACEQGPFKYMFEQFSPTGGKRGDQINDFYSEMMDGHVYKVVHDCASVIQNGHQFSLSGNQGTESFAFKGMNFFIPDYRLKYWNLYDTVGYVDANTPILEWVDGRDMNPYLRGNATGSTGVAFEQSSPFAVNFAQYNPAHAPKVGIYLITLEAAAKPSAGYDPEDPSTRFFDITLTWVSSLDEMTGSSVPQVFTIYYINDEGERVLLDELVVDIENPTSSLTLTYPWPQDATSQTFTYIVEGRGTGDHTPFVAWSNEDEVIIPGYNDFLAMELDHIESDFVIDEQRNYYRNFLTVTSENDLNGLSYTDILNAPGQQMSFDIMRSVTKPNNIPGEKKIATLTFFEPTATTVKYRIEYVEDEEQQRLDYTVKTEDGTITDAYKLENMGIDTEGELRVRGNGDIVIQPNGYHVNFKSITIKNGNNVLMSWTYADGALSENDGWYLSPGSVWVEHETDDGDITYYLEGGGYIYIPGLLNQYSTLTVEIEAFGDGATIARVLVNDKSERFQNNTPETISWTVRASNNGGSKAPNNNTNN